MDLPRHLTLLPLFFFVIGWGLFVAGFGWLLGTSDNSNWDHGYEFSYTSRTDPSLYHFYVTLVGGPFVALAGLFHALVTIPILGSILGFISAVLSVIYFVSTGTAAQQCSAYVINTLYNPRFSEGNGPPNVKVVFMLSGTLVQGVCWCIVLMLSVFYKYRVHDEAVWWNTVLYYRPSVQRRWPFTPGLGRILCIPCVILSVVGWCVYTGGVYNSNTWPLFLFYTDPNFIVPPLLYLAALLHAGCSGGASTIMGVFTAILNMLFLSFMGVYTTTSAMSIRYGDCKYTDFHGCYYEKFILGGGITCLFFWGCVLTLWPFYRKHPPPNQTLSTYGTVQDYTTYHSSATQPLIQNQ